MPDTRPNGPPPYALAITVMAGASGLVLAAVLRFFGGGGERRDAAWVLAHLSDADRAAYYEEFAQLSPGIWDAVPDPAGRAHAPAGHPQGVHRVPSSSRTARGSGPGASTDRRAPGGFASCASAIR